jgi:uncharacterized protein DUF4214
MSRSSSYRIEASNVRFREVSQMRSFLRQTYFNFLIISFLLAAILMIASERAAAATLVVPSGGSLQSALNAAQPGDTIVLQAGATYTGPFLLPNKSGSDFITVQSSALEFLPSGQRVSPANSALMPKLVSPGANQSVISVAAGAHHYQFIGVEVAPVTASAVVSDLIKLGDSSQTSLDVVAHHLILDRCYIHGFPTQEVKRGVALNSGEASIINSYISDIHGVGYDTQAICGWNGPGPYHIINNYLEAAGENVMFGGADPAINGLVPSDIEIRRNTFFKPLSWKVGDPSYAGHHWTVKNIFELKNSRRVVVDGNVFDGNWVDAQAGWAILIKSQNQDGGCPWCVTEDVTFSNNIIKNTPHGLNLSARDPYTGSGQLKNVRVVNNLWIVNGGWYQGTGDGKLPDGSWATDGADGVVLEHNTHLQVTPLEYLQNTMTLYGQPARGFVCRNNLGVRTGYGIKGEGTGEGVTALAMFAPGYIYTRNVLVGASPSEYPAGNFYPGAFADVQLGSDYRLSPTSPYRNAGTDGKDVGVDVDALEAALGGSSGNPGPTPTPTPSSTPTPSPSPTATPTPTPSPSPSPTPTTGPGVRKAKKRGQSLSNQLASSGDTGASNAAQTNTAETESLALFISEILEAQSNFNAERTIFPAATRIDVELCSALDWAMRAQTLFGQGDLEGTKNSLREAINHLELSDVLITNGNISNPIDVASYMVRQHYVDFLDREPDEAGNDFWVSQITNCGADTECNEVKRIHVSAAFFLSIEFRHTGYFVYRVYKSSFGRMPLRAEFLPDTHAVSRGVIVGRPNWETDLAASKQAFLDQWVQRADFNSRYSRLTNRQYVDALIANLGVTISSSERNSLISSLANGGSRATVLGRLVENDAFSLAQFNSAFVLMEYIGYLGRDPDAAGFNFWLNKLNQFNGDYGRAEMVRAFLSSIEYRDRFRLQ